MTEQVIKERRFRAALKRHGPALAAIFTVTALAYLSPIFRGLVYASQDTADQNYAMLRSHVINLTGHGLTAWCPGLFTGFYRAADPTFALFSPRALLYLLFSGYSAQTAGIIAMVLWAGAGAYLLGLALTRSRPAALYLGMAWPMAGAVASMTKNVPYLGSSAWLPWALAFWLAPRRVLARAALAGGCAAMMALAGDLFGAIIALGVMAGISAIHPASGSRMEEAKAWVMSALFAGGLSAVSWLPALDLIPESVRAGGLDLSLATSYSLHPARLFNLLAPRFWGQIGEFSFWGQKLTSQVHWQGLWFDTVYLGLLAPPLWAAAISSKQDRKKAAAMIAVAAALMVLALGRHTPLVPWLMERIQILRTFRYPAKLFTYSSMLLLAVSAVGLARLHEIIEEEGPRRVAIGSGLFYLVALAVVVALAARSAPDIRELSTHPDLSFIRIRQDMIRLLVFAGGVPLILYLLGGRARPAVLMAVLAAVTALDMLSALPAPYLAGSASVSRPSPVAEYIKARGKGRVVVADDTYLYLKGGRRESLLPDWGVVEGVEHAFGKTAARPALISGLNTREELSTHGGAPFRVMAANFVLASLEPEGQWIKRLRQEGVIEVDRTYPLLNLCLYRTLAAYPRFFVTRDIEWAGDRGDALARALEIESADPNSARVVIPREAAMIGGRMTRPAPPFPEPAGKSAAGGDEVIRVDRPDGDRLEIEVELPAPGLLVVREYLMAGWKARVSGEEVPVYFADGVGRAVMLPGGRHVVEFNFKPRGLCWGLVISPACLVIILLILIKSRVRPGAGISSKS